MGYFWKTNQTEKVENELINVTYCNVVIVLQKPIEEPHYSIESNGSRQCEWQVFYTFSSYYPSLQHPKFSFFDISTSSLYIEKACMKEMRPWEVITMMLNGAAHTATLKTAQIHPTTESRGLPFISNMVSNNTTPKLPMLKMSNSFIVCICAQLYILFVVKPREILFFFPIRTLHLINLSHVLHKKIVRFVSWN